jgi:hypothetical protein
MENPEVRRVGKGEKIGREPLLLSSISERYDQAPERIENYSKRTPPLGASALTVSSSL